MRGMLRARGRKAADEAITKLNGDLEELGLLPASRRLRVAIRARYYISPMAQLTIELPAGLLTVLWLDAIATTWLKGRLWPPLAPFAQVPIEGWKALRSGNFDTASETLTASILAPVVAAVIFLSLWVAPLVVAAATTAGRGLSLSRSTRMATRFRSISLIATAVSQCARAEGAGWRQRPKKHRRVARALARVEDEIMRLHRTSGYVTPLSHRKRHLKDHAGLVVAALRRAEARIDTEGDAALAPLAALLMTIADRIAEGRIGALLDDLPADLTPARDREPLRLAVAAILVAACAVGVAFLPMPEGTDVYVIGGCGIVILAVLYGRRVHQLLDVLNVIRGV
ncbi:hypothetical protein LZP81_30965 [Streptomyces parvulus]|uniref:hypothetical protein n=1 Tax=Streptomyces parvulus TaxID=146923 RepID=UPI001E328BD5|nr:hypothetical protein [Streptomyces parvulus]MCC9154875.1 hypothetical protein [Streptomyces parvulus]MCE7691280.1 hypothetical protein [Streptomyces parvulus]